METELYSEHSMAMAIRHNMSYIMPNQTVYSVK